MANLVRCLHVGIVIFVLIGWGLPWPLAWKIHCILIPLMILQWRLNRNVCVLTSLENRLRGKNLPENVDGEEDQFVRSLLKKTFNYAPPKERLEIMIRAIAWMAWGVSLYRINS